MPKIAYNLYQVYWKLCRRKILVMEWVDGVRLTSPSLAPATKTKLVNSLVQCSLQQVSSLPYGSSFFPPLMPKVE